MYNTSSNCEKDRKGSESNCSWQESDKDFSEEDLSNEIEFHFEDISIEKNKKLHKHVLIISWIIVLHILVVFYLIFGF